MTPDEKREIEATVMRLIEYDFHIDFRQLYDTAVTLLHEPLFQAGEETRNFLEHCGVALAAETKEAADLDLARGKRHLYYGKYVCLMVPTLAGLDALEAKVHARELRASVPHLRLRLETIRLECAKIPLIDEVVRRPKIEQLNADIDTINASNLKFERVLTEIVKFQSEIDSRFFRPGLEQIAVTPSFVRVLLWFYLYKKRVIIFAVSMNLVAAILYALAFERPLRHGIDLFVERVTGYKSAQDSVALPTSATVAPISAVPPEAPHAPVAVPDPKPPEANKAEVPAVSSPSPVQPANK